MNCMIVIIVVIVIRKGICVLIFSLFCLTGPLPPPVLLPPLPANLQRVSLPPSLPSSHLEAMFWKAVVLNSFSQYLNLPGHFFRAFTLRVNALIPKSFSWAWCYLFFSLFYIVYCFVLFS